VLVLEADPGRIAAELSVSLRHPRDQDDPATLTASAEVRRALHAAHAI
jgi:ABC-type nitrate/sulfonate/bicarbonate transport system ATPase subunit